MIWGGEAVAISPDARANPNQLILNDQTYGDIAALRELWVWAHHERFGDVDDRCSPIPILSDILSGKPMQRKRFCRTFSDCTTGPRNSLVSGCYPLDEFYKQHPDADRLAEIKQRLSSEAGGD
jgi:hypothetical protein